MDRAFCRADFRRDGRRAASFRRAVRRDRLAPLSSDVGAVRPASRAHRLVRSQRHALLLCFRRDVDRAGRAAPVRARHSGVGAFAAFFRSQRGGGPRLAAVAPRGPWLWLGRPVKIHRRARAPWGSRLPRDLAVGASLVSPSGALCRGDACRADCPSGLRVECPAQLGLLRLPGLARRRLGEFEAVAGPPRRAWADRLSVPLAVRPACSRPRLRRAPLARRPAAFSFVPLPSADCSFHGGAAMDRKRPAPLVDGRLVLRVSADGRLGGGYRGPTPPLCDSIWRFARCARHRRGGRGANRLAVARFAGGDHRPDVGSPSTGAASAKLRCFNPRRLSSSPRAGGRPARSRSRLGRASRSSSFRTIGGVGRP